jgi:hypothetical protein
MPVPPFAGMIEPALYVNVAPGTKLSIKRAVSWHLHAICWGGNRSQMRERFRRLNQDGIYRSLLDSQLGAHQVTTSLPESCVSS